MSLRSGRPRGYEQDFSLRPGLDGTGGRISGALVRIPKDQESLLEKGSAWAKELKSNPRGPVNIPSSVLDSLVSFHHVKKSAVGRPSPAKASAFSKVQKSGIPQGRDPTNDLKRQNQSRGFVSQPLSVLENPLDGPGTQTGPQQSEHVQTPAPPKGQETSFSENAWFGTLNDQPHGPVNVPPSVLKSLEKFHTKQVQHGRLGRVEPTSPSPQARTSSISSGRIANSGHGESEPATPMVRNHSPSQRANESPPRTDISWSLSPVRDRDRIKVIPRLGNSAAISSPTRSPVPSNRPLAPAEEPDLPRSRVSPVPVGPSQARDARSTSSMKRPVSLRKNNPPMPSSSVDNSEDELPLVPPMPFNRAERVTINRLAQPGPTPPSAQIIPCSERQSREVDQEPPRRKRPRMQTLDESIWDDPEVQVQPPEPQEPSLQPKAVSTREAEARPVAQPTVQAPKAPEAPRPLADLQPFDLFRAAYPDYSGDLESFLRACIAVSYLEKRGELAVFLYDDFIRAFTHSYVPYVLSLTEETSPPLAIKWYNRNTTQFIYNKGVVDSNMAARVFEVYSDKIAGINEELGGQTQAISVYLDSQPRDETLADEQSEEDDVQLEGRVSAQATGSPELSTPASSLARPGNLGPGERPRNTTDDWTRAPDTSSQPAVIIPNTSRSVLEENPTRIPETVRKPRLPLASARYPRKTSSGRGARESLNSKIRKARQSMTGSELRKSLREHMMRNPHPRLASSGQQGKGNTV